MSMDIIEVFRKRLFANSISLERAGRFAVMILGDTKLSDIDKKEQIIDLYMSRGFSKETAEKQYEYIIERLSKFRVYYVKGRYK